MKFKNLLKRNLLSEDVNSVYYHMGLDSLLRHGDQSELEVIGSRLVIKSHMHLKDDIDPETLETDKNYDYIKVVDNRVSSPDVVNVKINPETLDKKIVPLKQGLEPILSQLEDSNISVYEVNGSAIKGPRKNQLLMKLMEELSSEKSELGRSVQLLSGKDRNEYSSDSYQIPELILKKNGSIRGIYNIIRNFEISEKVKFYSGKGIDFKEDGSIEVSDDFKSFLEKLLHASRRLAHLRILNKPTEKAIVTKFLELTPGKATVILSPQNLVVIKKMVEKTEIRKKQSFLNRLLSIGKMVDIEVDGYDSLKDFVDSIEIKYTV